MKLLLIDDDRTDEIRQLCDDLGLDHNVTRVFTRSELEKALSTKSFDAIILDLMMATLDESTAEQTDAGYIAGAYLYETAVAPSYSSVPFIVLTAVDTRTTVFDVAMRRLKVFPGFRGYVEKPADADGVLAKLEEAQSK